MNVESYVHSSSCPSSFHAVRFTEGFCGRDISRADTNPCALKDSLSTIGRRCWPLPHHHGHSSKTLARAMGTHAVGCAVELAREFLHQQVMIPAGVVAFNMVPSAIERVGNGPHHHRRGPLPRDGRDKPRWRVVISAWRTSESQDRPRPEPAFRRPASGWATGLQIFLLSS